nr:helix-turn-helix transcriptional regulator [uncultured Oscillibacter sp.]
MTFGERVQGLRQKAGLSQDALAEQLGVSRQAVSRWERDETMPETDKVVALANLFGVTTDYLLRKETPEAAPERSGADGGALRLIRRKGYLLGWLPVMWGILCLVLTAAVGLQEAAHQRNLQALAKQTGIDMSSIPPTYPKWVIILAFLIGIMFLIAGICVLRAGKRRAEKERR